MAKVVRGSERRKTRFHTERGERLPLAELGNAGRSVVRRLRAGVAYDEPWIAPSATAALARMIDPSWRVLELGSGGSTVWFAERATHVVSFESDPDWARRTRERLAAANRTNVTMIEVGIDGVADELLERFREEFDLAVVDCAESSVVNRLDCLRAVAPLVRPGGSAVLDDSDREHLRGAAPALAGWTHRRYIGMKQFPLMAIETSIFTAPLGARRPLS